MKNLLRALCLLILTGAAHAETAPAAATGATQISLHATIPPDRAGVPVFTQATIDQTIRVSTRQINGAARIEARVLQGEPRLLSLELSGPGGVEKITGEQVNGWAVRQSDTGARFLEIHLKEPLAPGKTLAADIAFAPRDISQDGTAISASLVFGDGTATVSGTVRVISGEGARARIVSHEGLLPLASATPGEFLFRLEKSGEIQIAVSASEDAAVLENFSLRGERHPEHLGFALSATARVSADGAELQVLSGDAALRALPQNETFRVRVTPGKPGYTLVFPKAGSFPVRLEFDAKVRRAGDAQSVAFAIPCVQIAPFALAGFENDTAFVTRGMPALRRDGAHVTGFLPPDGAVAFSWTVAQADADARLFFSTEEVSQITVRPGLLRQQSRFDYKVLQGKMDTLRFALGGTGEILRVTGADVLAWQVSERESGRVLEVRLTQPKTGGYSLSIEAQSALAALPAKLAPLAIAPLDGVRHGGFVQVRNEGAVRLEATPLRGLTQVAPALFPEKSDDAENTQRFVFRVATAESALAIQADNILPEVSVSAVSLYGVDESDLFINAEIELDIREAPLREFILRIPATYTVGGAQLNDADYTTGESRDGFRELKIIPTAPLTGRQLLRCRLERARPANLAEWRLEPLAFPGAKSVRGFVGVVGAPGLRVSPSDSGGLTEIAPAFFPRQAAGLQQSFRLRDTDWSLALKIEKLDMAVQSDGLHLFAVREGLVGASTTINYAIVGAPLGEFRFAVPEGARNLEFSGRDIRGWKRDGDTVEVRLHKPVSGAYTLLGTYDLPLNPHGGVVSLEGLQPLGVQSEQGFALLTSELQFEVKNDTVSPALVPVEPDEIPAEYRMMFDAPLLAAFQYSARPYELKLGLAPRPRGAMVSQVVDFAALQTKVSRDGQIVTEARYVVKSHGHPHLRVTVPENLKLWTARVDDTAVLPVTDGAATLIPLPSRADANAIVTVDLRLAGTVKNIGKLRLDAPRPGAPVIRTQWKVTPDSGVVLRGTGGNLAGTGRAAAVSRTAGTDGAAWRFLGGGATAMVFATLAFFLARKLRAGGRRWTAILGGAIALGAAGAALLALAAAILIPFNSTTPEMDNILEFSAPVHLSQNALFLELRQGGTGDAALIGFYAIIGTALILGAVAWRKKSAFLRAAAWAFLAAAHMPLDTSSPEWLALVAALFFLVEVLPSGLACFKPLKTAPVLLALLLAMLGGSGTADLRAEKTAPMEAAPPEARHAESVEQRIFIREKRIEASGKIRVNGTAGDRFDMVAAPAVLTHCEPPAGARLARVSRPDGTVVVQLVLEKSGAFTVDFRYELPFGLEAKILRLPTSVAATDNATVALSGGDWHLSSDAAVSVRNEAAGEEFTTAALLVFMPRAEREIRWTPRERDRRGEQLVFYAESADLFVPSLGVLDGRHLLRIRPAQGLLGELRLKIPAGFSVANVSGAAVGRWRFDPGEQLLRVSFEPAQAVETKLLVETQRGTGALPQTFRLEPLSIEGAAGQVGLVALGTGEDVQLAEVTPEKMLAVSVEDFPSGEFGPANGTGVVVRRGFRYGAPAGAALMMKTVAVQPDVRVSSSQRISLGEDRTVLAADIRADITRAGIFRLSFPLPDGLEIESISGPALSHWTEVPENDRRVAVLHLRGRTLGEQQFTLSLAGPGLSGQTRWTAPRVSLREASRQNGELFLIPEEGVRLHGTARSGATQFDPGPQARLPKGAQAFRLVQDDWSLAFDIESLAPWIQCAYLQDVTVRDGQVRDVVNFEYTIENAATKTLRVRLPDTAGSVRFTGPLVADATPVPGETGLWEVRLQRRVLGKTTLQATFQRPAAGGGAESIGAVSAADAGLQHGWLSLRASGRLELKVETTPPALAPTDWQSVPASLRQGAAEPVAVLRMVENAFTLPVSLAMHDPARLLAVRVERADLQTLLSEDGVMLTRVRLDARLAQKGLLRVTLPEGAVFWHGFVNNEPVRVAKDDRTLLLPVMPNPLDGQATEVEFYYSAATTGGRLDHKLAGPRFDVPLENITWQVRLPDGRVLDKQRSDLQIVESGGTGKSSGRNGATVLSSVSDYQDYNKRALKQKYATADTLIQLGNKLRSEGDQGKAVQALNLANTLSVGNAALNEDARVQLNALRVEQIEVGLNRRKNLVAIMNSNTGTAPVAGQQLLPATSLSRLNYRPDEVLQQRNLNTAEDNTVMRQVAERFLRQQQSAAGVLDSIRTTLPEHGETLVFTRSLQVGTDSDLSLEVSLTRPTTGGGFWPWLMTAVAFFAGAWFLPRLVRRKGMAV